NGTGSLIFQRGYDRDLAITAGNFTVNSSSTTPVTLLDSSMGILTFTLTGNLSITSSFTGITGSWGQLGSEARVTVGGNLSINGGNFNLVTKADAPAKLTVNGNTTLNSTAAGSVSFLDGGNYNLTFITNDLIITSGQNNYLFGRPGSVLYPKGSGTFTINNNLTINGNSNTYVAWSDSNTNKIRFTVGHDATLNGAGALFVVGNTNGALTFKTSNLYTQTSGRFIGQSYDQNLNTDSVIFGGSFLFNSVTASDYFKANRSSGPTIVNTTSNFTVQNSGTASNQGVICVDSSASNLTFTVGGNFVQNGGLFCGIVNGSGNCTFNVTGIVDVNAGNFTCLNNTLTTTSSTITFTANSIDYDGGYFNAFNTCNTSSGSGVFTITSACKINFASTSDFFSFIGLAKTAFDLNNLTLNLQVGGSFTISGANGTFISSQSLGAETISVGSFNVSAGNNSFNTVQGTTFGNGHSVNFTVTGNVAISGGTTFFSAATQGVTLTVNGDFTLSGGTASVKGGDNAGTSVVNILGAYNQSNGNFYLHNAPTDELNTGAIITMTVNSNADNNGDFTHTGGTFTYDNSATTPSTLTLSLVIKSPNYTLGGSGLITMTKAGTGNVYGNLSFARTGTIAYTRTGTHNIQQVLQTIQDNCTLDMVSGDLIVSSNNNSRGTFPDWFNIFPNGVLNMRTNSIQSNRLNTFSGITVLGRLKLQHTNGMYNGTVNAALATNITDNFDYYLSSGSTVEYNGVDNQIITGMGIGKALLTNHKYFNLAINFTGTADAEFVYPTNSPNDSAVQVRNSVVLTAGELNLDNDHNPSNGGGRMIVIENSAVTAISRTSGYIRSEVENGSALVKWTMNTVAGNHIIPFGYNSTTYIPLTATVSSGSAANFYAGTYRTSSANLPLPPTVTHIQNGSGTNISPICVDRYWYLNTTGTPTMNMNYTFSSTEAGSITSFNAIRWITAPPSWTSPPPGTQTPGTLSVQANGLSTIKNWWTVSGNIQLTITASAGAHGSISPNGNTLVNFGANQTFNITADPCYTIADVIVDGVSQGAISSYTFTNVIVNHAISASFNQINYPVNASAGSNGSISSPGITNVPCGTNITYTITPAPCYSIANVIVDGVSQGIISSYTFTNVTTSHSISATFAQINYSITASAGSNGSISPSGISNLACGSNQTYLINANSCYSIADVLVDGVSQGAISSYTFNTIGANHTISASFTLNTYVLSGTAGSHGTISPSGISTVNCGSDFTYTITPDLCYIIDDVLVDGVSQGAIISYTFSNVTTTHNISASFTRISYTITASAGANGSISPNGANTVLCGNDQTFTITPNSCYAIDDVVVDGVSQGAITSYTFTNTSASHTISATFVQLSYSITSSAGPNGSITPLGTSTVLCGNDQSYSITPDPCFAIEDVIVDGVSQGAINSYTFSGVTSSHSISATFVQITYTITASAGAHGSISPNGISTFNCGTDHTYNITADPCYEITEVLVDGVSQGVISAYTFTSLSASHTISVTFNQITYTITASAGPNGSISPNGANTVLCGNDQTFTITPNPCYAIDDVLVDGVSQGAITSYTFTNTSSSHTISATFVQLSYSITSSAGPNGSITPLGSSTVLCGNDQSYSITPDPCFAIEDVIVDGVSQGAISSYTFSGVTTSHSISATFVQITYTITASAGAHGSISPNGISTFNCGTDHTYNITADPCYEITDVLVDGVSQGVISSYTFTSLSASHTINVTFNQITYTISASAGSNGSISPNGANTVLCGNDQTFTITPNACYAIDDVVVDGVSQGAITSYTFTNTSTSHTISATFVQLSYSITSS
ncbi:MAG TPA: hypothetical protein PKL85_06710, partial [Bacteroidia bacterium]|nr:hypothetical protein [Bacteroidia bacterium]